MSGSPRALAIGSVALGGAIAVGVLTATLVLHEPRHAVIAIAEYLLLSGGLSLVIGIGGLTLGMWYLPRLSLKVGLGYAVGSLGAILTILVTPLLMFKERSDLYLLALLLVCFLIISLGLAAIIGTSVARRVVTLDEAAQRIAEGRFETRVESGAGDELASLARSINRMSEELGTAFERQRAMEQDRRELVAAISHDLRTPLAASRAMLEAIEDGVAADSTTVAEYHRAMLGQLSRLERLIDDLFELSRLESGTVRFDLMPVDLNELLDEAVGSLVPQADRQGVRIELAEAAPLGLVQVDPGQMQRVVTNLVQNAIRHSPAGGVVRVTADLGSEGVTVEVMDSGEGIAGEDLPYIFDRFYRGEKSRSRESGGAGLGLAISKAIVEAHRGRIRAENAAQGARFVMTLPFTTS